MKLLLSCVFLIALACASDARNAKWGSKSRNDYVLSRQTEIRYPVRNNAWNINVNYASKYNRQNISAIYVYDNFRNSSGAVPTLLSGGPKNSYANIYLQGRVRNGINSTVEIWGH